jgi:hypothetical protein
MIGYSEDRSVLLERKVRTGAMARLGCLLMGLTALAVFAACSGRTTGASDITEQPDGSYSAKLNGVGTCDEGSSSTPCTAYIRWREVGTDAWTNGPSIEVDRKVSNRRWSQTAKGLSPKAEYEYQACGKEFSDEQAICVGPDGTPRTTEKFVAIEERQATNDVDRNKAGARDGPAGNASSGSQGGGTGLQSNGTGSQIGGEGGTSPLLPIVIAVGAVSLVLGAAWWARRQAYW